LDIIQAVESTVNLTNSVFNNLNAVGQTEVIYVESAALFFISNCQFLSANIDYVFSTTSTIIIQSSMFLGN
jgi:hypothetical protein